MDTRSPNNGKPEGNVNGSGVPVRWHRIRTIRQREGISLKTISRRSHIGMQRLRQEEVETRDLTLSQLYAWQKALRVPISELVVDAEEALEEKIRLRAALLRLTRTAKTILREAQKGPVRNLANTMLQQIYEVMPEAEAMNPWNEVGQRRNPRDVPRILERTVPTAASSIWRLSDDATGYTTCDI
jgi:transcriptional regulator with XRE-family HTH domain